MTALRVPLLPLAAAYGAVAALRRRAYRDGYLVAHRVGAPVISVGAIAAGGSGKTPVAGWLAGELLARGRRVGIVHGGYLALDRSVRRVDPALRWAPGAARQIGDEPLLLAGWHPQAITVCGRDKVGAARCAVAEGAEVVIVDDGFQHRRLHRDLDLLLDDGRSELPFPAGRGRESAGAARDADLRWEHRRAGEPCRGDAPLGSRCVPDGLHALDGRRLGPASELRGRRVFLLAGIARPEAFRSTVEQLGARVVGQAWARDHHPFSAGQLRAAARSRALTLCTEKDAARLGVTGPGDLLYLGCRLQLTRGEELLRSCLGRLLGGET